MLFDEYLIDRPGISTHMVGLFREHMKSLIVFHIEDSLFDFVEQDTVMESFVKGRQVEALPSPLPYDGLALCFENAVVTVTCRRHSNGWPGLLCVTEAHAFEKEMRGKRGFLDEDGRKLVLRTIKGTYRDWGPVTLVEFLRYDDAGNYLGAVDNADRDVAQKVLLTDAPIDDVPFLYGPTPGHGGLNEEEHGGFLAWSVGARLHLLLHRFTAFLSCTNVRTVDVVPTGREQRERKEKGRPPLVSYKVLQLLPRVASQSGDDKGLWTNRVHLCRGHFAVYTQAAPLFGKYVGRYWIPPHVRGDKKRGLVEKDYNIGKGEA